MKKALLTILALTAMMAARADGYPYLLFQTTSGTVHAMAVEALSMTISNGQLVAANNE